MHPSVPDWIVVPGPSAPVLVETGIVLLLVGLADVGLSISWTVRDGTRRMVVPRYTAALYLLGVALIAFGVTRGLT